MSDSKDQLASWASLIGSVVALLGLVQSQAWLTALGVCFVGLSAAALIVARRDRKLIQSARVVIDGLNIDSLNVANLRRRTNRSLVIQRAYHFAKIEGRDLTIAWQYDGFCRAKQETSMEFSIDAERNVPFNQLDCFAFDLQRDPNRLHRIQPMLIGGEGLSKKISVPFLKPLGLHEPFSVLLNCNLPECVGTGVQYYSSTLSFTQSHIERLAVHLVFIRNVPDWVRVYECVRPGHPTLINELRPVKDDGGTREYLDLVEQTSGQSVRIYVYRLAVGPLHGFIESRTD